MAINNFIKIKNTGGYKKGKYFFFSVNFISEIPNFSYLGLFQKCSIFRRSIPLKVKIDVSTIKDCLTAK